MSTFDFLILNTLDLEPIHALAVERRVVAQTRGFFGGLLRMESGSVEISLHRLEHEGWLDVGPQDAGNSSREKTYFLTAIGKEQLEAEWTRRRSALAHFVEEGGAPLFSFKTIPNSWN